ncbi:MAG: acyl-CoA thioesterase [Deltaproteobacteria bacterium]|nr:acyl-CoA thioesterase [Deltaproteobacteria bacterium]
MNKTPVLIRVIYADTDAMGIVYHTNYIRWFEVGRNELCRDMGILAADLQAAGFNLPLTRVFCHYHVPAHYDQMVLVETEIAYLKWASMKFTYKIWDESRNSLLAEGYTVHACTEANGKIIRIPGPLSEKIRSYYPNL